MAKNTHGSATPIDAELAELVTKVTTEVLSQLLPLAQGSVVPPERRVKRPAKLTKAQQKAQNKVLGKQIQGHKARATVLVSQNRHEEALESLRTAMGLVPSRRMKDGTIAWLKVVEQIMRKYESLGLVRYAKADAEAIIGPRVAA